MKETAIAVGILKRGAQVLIAKRQKGQHLGGFWEFPGGKVAEGETPKQALVREFQEEVGVMTDQWRPLIEMPWRYDDRQLRLHFWVCDVFEGVPKGCEGQVVKWLDVDQLDHHDFPPANRGGVHALQLPNQMMVTGRFDGLNDAMARLSSALEAGVRLVQLRNKALDEMAFFAWAREAIELCHSQGAQVVVNGPAQWLSALPEADGLQLSSASLMQLTQRPPQTLGRWLGASVHDPVEMARAIELGADYLLLSPVQTTESHPDMTPLGWPKFAEWVKDCPVPVYALGGVKSGDVDQARASGGQGIAAISGLWPQPL